MTISSWIDRKVTDTFRTVGYLKVHRDYNPELCDELYLVSEDRMRGCENCNWYVLFQKGSPRVQRQVRK